MFRDANIDTIQSKNEKIKNKNTIKLIIKGFIYVNFDLKSFFILII